MQQRSLSLSLLLAPLAVAAFSACSGMNPFGSKENEGLARVDDLLTCIEKVQVESLLAQEQSRAALESLRVLADPDFHGDAKAAHERLMAAVKESKTQAQVLGSSIAPMKEAAETLFTNWTADLESFGNSQMRQRSQARLEDTRARYQDVLTAAIAAQLAYDAYNADMKDQALFLANDLNAYSVSMVSKDVDALRDQERELTIRLNATMAAAKEYVASSALVGQVAAGEPVEQAPPAKRSTATARTPAKRTTAPPPAPAAEPETEAETETASTPEPKPAASKPAPPPAPKPVPEPKPAEGNG